MESKTEKKNCLQCGVEIIKNTTTQEKWDIKTTCSAECRKAFRKGKVLKETEPKTCSNCMKLYYKPIGLTQKDFEKRKYCSTECSQMSRRGTRAGAGFGFGVSKRSNIVPHVRQPKTHIWRPDTWGGPIPIEEKDSE